MACETEFKAVMEFLSTVYGEEIDTARLQAYDLMLAHFPGEVLAAAAHRNLHVVTVRGEQGVGKTRFMYAWVHCRTRENHSIGNA